MLRDRLLHLTICLRHAAEHEPISEVVTLLGERGRVLTELSAQHETLDKESIEKIHRYEKAAEVALSKRRRQLLDQLTARRNARKASMLYRCAG